VSLIKIAEGGKEMVSKVANFNPDEFITECIVCGRAEALSCVAHRNDKRIVGFIFACPDCSPKVYGAGFSLLLTKKA